MVIFIVPVKSKTVSGDWDFFTKLVERTLRSICNQTSEDYKVIMSCHETPQIEYSNSKIQYHNVTFPPPVLKGANWERARMLKEEDKSKKILEGIEISKRFNPSHIMVVDSDDCIHQDIVKFVMNDETNAPGWFIKKGYYYQEGKPYAILNKNNFNKFCGSCIIIKNELVNSLFIKEPFLYYDHFTMSVDHQFKLEPLPFAGALYSVDNGENHFMTVANAVRIAKSANNYWVSLRHKLKKYRPVLITKSFKKKFNFYYIK